MPRGTWLGFCLIAVPSSFDEFTPRESMVTKGCTAVPEPFYTFGAINIEAVGVSKYVCLDTVKILGNFGLVPMGSQENTVKGN